MSLRPPFNLIRAAFLLLAAMIIVQLLVTVFTAGGCLWLILTGASKIGACENVTATIRDIWAEMLAAILALLLAGRGGNGRPPEGGER